MSDTSTKGSRWTRRRKLSVAGVSAVLIAGVAVGGTLLVRGDHTDPDPDALKTQAVSEGWTAQEVEDAYASISEGISEGYSSQIDNPLLPLDVGCVLDGGEYDARLHEDDLGWCVVPAGAGDFPLSNTRFGCYMVSGEWTDSTGRFPDLTNTDIPAVGISGDSTPDIPKVTGTCVRPGGEAVGQVSVHGNALDHDALAAVCSAAGGVVDSDRVHRAGVVDCDVTGRDAVSNRYVLAEFAGACWDQKGTYEDRVLSSRLVTLVGTCDA
ncbi:hypothetical protein P5W04_10380 [Mycobacteroides abscessus subsp. abscessus]|uniref:hypothetical protein n=1 Tax=Mycobacteroides abscessus TaxID=36809 RepID=UPI0011C451A8|nr:hypothetical protein [Mycobacteroides abscessus]MBN7484537.1 hypothetical protein [Mycobacteroides abscessus subsp. abscessus]MDO3240521.1 hypothetical protein [Mycobacteroides abscessus subsp. abscessus]